MSPMRCVHCGRAMSAPAAVVSTRYGLRYYGPKCAKAAGFMRPARATVRISSKARRQWPDDRQADWVAL